MRQYNYLSKRTNYSRQAAYEVRLRVKHDRDVIIDLREKMRNWKSMKPIIFRRHGIYGFIQELSVAPFYVTFYLQEHVELYTMSCDKECDGTIFIDSTGGVVRQFPDQKCTQY